MAFVYTYCMPITDEVKDKLKARLSKAIGHLNSVYKMVDDKKYCIDVLNQLKAVQAALDRTAELMLRNHLETCVVEAIKNQDTTRVVDELVQVFRKAPGLYVTTDEESSDGVPFNTLTAQQSSQDGCCH